MSNDEDSIACLTVALIFLLTAAWVGALIWLIVAVIGWLGRH